MWYNSDKICKIYCIALPEYQTKVDWGYTRIIILNKLNFVEKMVFKNSLMERDCHFEQLVKFGAFWSNPRFEQLRSFLCAEEEMDSGI